MSWVVRTQFVPSVGVRLFCFPFAGASAAVFRSWQERLDGIGVCAVELPGKGARVREPACATSMRELAAATCEGLQPHLSPEFALFGHSFGALLAFEVARELRRRGAPSPEHLFISGRRGPRLPEPGPALHTLPTETFVAGVRERYDGIPDAVLQEPALLELLVPALRADFQALETYTYVPEEPLACPITAFGGSDDPWARSSDLEAWRTETTAEFELVRFPGGHFYLKEAEDPVLAEIAARIASPPGLAAEVSTR